MPRCFRIQSMQEGSLFALNMPLYDDMLQSIHMPPYMHTHMSCIFDNGCIATVFVYMSYMPFCLHMHGHMHMVVSRKFS